MYETPFQSEFKAYKALQELMANAEEVRRLFVAANMDIPAVLDRMFGNSDNNDKPLQMPDLVPPEAPFEREPHWIWLSATDVNPSTLVFSILRGESTPLSTQELHVRAARYHKDLSLLSIQNLLLRTEGEIVQRSGAGGWSVIDREKVPILLHKYVWGPKEFFASQEVAMFRRMMILRLLETAPNGAQVVEVVACLNNANEKRVPIQKDAVRTDMEALMADRLVTKDEETKKYKAVPINLETSDLPNGIGK